MLRLWFHQATVGSAVAPAHAVCMQLLCTRVRFLWRANHVTPSKWFASTQPPFKIKWGGIHRDMRGKLDKKLLKQLEDAVDELQKRRVEYVEYGDPEKTHPKEESNGRVGTMRLRYRDLPQEISSTLKTSIGRCKPLSVSSPTGSAVVLPSMAARTLPSIKIWPSRASAQRRAARLTTVPIAL